MLLLVLTRRRFRSVEEDAKRDPPRHHPLGISGHVGRFDVVPTPRRRRKRSKNGSNRGENENENERTRESNAITSGTRRRWGRGEVRETRTWRDAKWSETRLSFSPGRAVSWTDGGVETVRHRESWRGKRLMDEYSKFWRGRRPISMNYEWIRLLLLLPPPSLFLWLFPPPFVSTFARLSAKSLAIEQSYLFYP